MAGESDAVDPTELAGVAEMGTESARAWSEDEIEEFPPTTVWERIGPRRVTAAAVGVAVVVIAGAVAATIYMVHGPNPVTVAPPVAISTRVASTPRVLEPVPVKPRVESPETDALDDQLFLHRLMALGWKIGNPVQVAATGRQVCELLARDGRSPVWVEDQIMVGGKSRVEAEQFTEAAIAVFPNCP